MEDETYKNVKKADKSACKNVKIINSLKEKTKEKSIK